MIEGPHRSNALAEAVHSDPSTVSRQIAALVKVGYVERRPDPADGRACLLAATDELITDQDGWTLRSADGSRGAHSEHTVAITDDGPIVLTDRSFLGVR